MKLKGWAIGGLIGLAISLISLLSFVIALEQKSENFFINFFGLLIYITMNFMRFDELNEFGTLIIIFVFLFMFTIVCSLVGLLIDRRLKK